jgi:2-(1,2-epoxy-1,2-dihydrophenyl)acetyl-CoA isomerase
MNVIELKIESNIGFIRLNRPEVFNSFNREMALALIDALDHCESNEEVRCLVITGNGKAFSAGQDLNEAIDESNGISFEVILNEHYNPIIKRIREIEKPIIAAVNGVAAGAGCNIALACDFTVASFKASFTQAFSKIGLVPDSGGTYLLTRLVGLQRATALMMLSDKVTAQEAEQMGLIYKSVEADIFDTYIQQLAERIVSMPAKALGMTKRLINLGLQNPLEKQLEIEGLLQVEAGNAPEYKEGVSAFLEKRSPNFKQLKTFS